MKGILVVDDDPPIRNMFRDILSLYGYEFIGAIDGREAIEKYKEMRPEVVVMDILMPGIDGVKTTRKILQHDPKAKIIVVTAVTRPNLGKKCVKAGAKAFLMKPFKVEEFVDTIKKLEV